jgi:hypothetical protein
MTAAVYWAAGAAAGIADGCVLAVEELFPWPGGAVLGACGIESPRSKKAQVHMEHGIYCVRVRL